jgi:hypothetical protein
MSWRTRQRGDVPVGCILGLILLLIVALIGIKVVPVMIKFGELDREIEALADRANRWDYTDKRIRDRIILKAEELDLPVTEKDVRIERSKNWVKVWVEYQYEIDFPGYTYVWHKEHYENRPLF